MPEGDTIHKVAAAMAPGLEHRQLERIEFAPRHGPPPPASEVQRVYAHGKHKSEILFLARVHPRRGLADTCDRRLEQLYGLGVDLLSRNLGGGRRVTRFAADGRARLWVYGRHGAACLRCDDGVTQRAALGHSARGTFWCPRCQAD